MVSRSRAGARGIGGRRRMIVALAGVAVAGAVVAVAVGVSAGPGAPGGTGGGRRPGSPSGGSGNRVAVSPGTVAPGQGSPLPAPDGFAAPPVAFSPGRAWLVANQSLYDSNDGGATWRVDVAPGSPLGAPTGVGYWGAKGGWLTAIGPRSATRLYLTGDQGAHWHRVNAPANLVWVQFTDPSHGWALDADATLWRSTDGSRSWTAVATPGFFNTVCAGGAGTVIGVPEYAAAGVEQTRDAGAEWEVAYPLPASALTGSSYALCSPSSPTREVTVAERATAGVVTVFLASTAGGPWRTVGHSGLGLVLPVAVSPRGAVIAAVDGPHTLDVYRSDGVHPMTLVARLPAVGYPQPAGPVEGGFSADGTGMLVLPCGTSVFTAVTNDDGSTWSSHQGTLANAGYNTNSSC